MQTNHRMFDDAARVAGGLLGTVAGIRREVEALVRQQIERFMGGMDLVTRDEFEAVKAMAAKARTEQEAIESRLAALEGGKHAAPKATAPKARKAASPKRTAARRPTKKPQ